MEQQYPKEQEQVETWMKAHFVVGALPPFSFTYGGKSSSEFLSHWQFSQETKQLDNARTEHLFTYTATDRPSGLLYLFASLTDAFGFRFTSFTDFQSVGDRRLRLTVRFLRTFQRWSGR